MAIYQGDIKISGNAKVSSLPLFTTQWQDHITNDASWLRSETFSWQSGAVYVSAYNHLVDDIDGITSETETVAGTTITFKRAADGHKIVLPDQETNVSTIYTATGIAWYYILDTTNERFKLPRSKYNFVGLRDNVGNYVAESLPNITGNIRLEKQEFNSTTGAFSLTGAAAIYAANGANRSGNYGQATFNASSSSSTYQNGAPVQQRATQAYLYFYVGNTVQNQTEIDVAQITEDLNGKADIDLGNLSNTGKSTSAHLAMPSDTYDDLTLGASGNTYIMPADGYLFLRMTMTGAYSNMTFQNDTTGKAEIRYSAGTLDAAITMPVHKSEVIRVYYGAEGTATKVYFRFYYAEGSKTLA